MTNQRDAAEAVAALTKALDFLDRAAGEGLCLIADGGGELDAAEIMVAMANATSTNLDQASESLIPEFVSKLLASLPAASEQEPSDLVIAGPWIDGDNTDEDDQPVWHAEVQTVGGHSVVAETWGGSFEQAMHRAEAIQAALDPAPSDQEKLVGEFVAWFDKATPDDAGADYLNEGGWDDMAALITRARQQGEG